MNQGRRLQLSLVSLIDEEMLQLAPTVRFTALTLLWRAGETGTARLNLPILKGTFFPLDDSVTVETLTTDVLELESVGYLETWIADDGHEHYRIAPRYRATSAPDQPHSLFIGSVDRESESEGESREGESDDESAGAPHASRKPLPERFCPDHRPGGSNGKPCVICRDYRMAFTAALDERARAYGAKG